MLVLTSIIQLDKTYCEFQTTSGCFSTDQQSLLIMLVLEFQPKAAGCKLFPFGTNPSDEKK